MPIDLDRIVARKIPRHTDIAGRRLHDQSTSLGKEFENLLKRLARCRIDCPKTRTGEHDLPRAFPRCLARVLRCLSHKSWPKRVTHFMSLRSERPRNWPRSILESSGSGMPSR